MMRPLMWLGLIAWGFCVLDWGIAYSKQPRNVIRLIVVMMGSGWLVLLARELHVLPRFTAQAVVLAGVMAGIFSGAVLLIRWVRNPRILD